MVEKINQICPDLNQECLDKVKKACPSMDDECLSSLSQMDYMLVGRENFNLSAEQMIEIEKSCRNPFFAKEVYEGERGYLQMLKDISRDGMLRSNRTGVNTKSIFHANIAFNLHNGFPALTTKRLFWNGVMGELLWFLAGKNDLSSLRRFTFGVDDNQKTIWDIDFNRWEEELKRSGREDEANGSGGTIYGMQWRNFTSAWSDNIYSIDQIKEVLEEAKRNPQSRRLVVNAWNGADIINNNMALPPCHMSFQLYIECGRVNLKWNQRSVDCFLGLPFNIASYAMLCHIFAKWLGLKAGWIVGDLTNVHVYETHTDAIKEQLSNYILPLCTAPRIPNDFSLDNIEDFTALDFPLIGYQSHPAIKAPMAG